MSLADEIELRSRQIHTDAYPMSIGELVNLYRDRELDLQPEFQRMYRWSALQKSKLIESILLGIPIPSIFVAQRKIDGVWDVVDGLQRLSTIFQFVGALRDASEGDGKPIKLVGTDYLPSLEGAVWDAAAAEALGGGTPLDQTQRLVIKRTKLLMNIIKQESAEDTKLELFRRLNTLGTSLSDQEQRNCLLLLTNRDAFSWANDLATHPSFQDVTSLSDPMYDQRYDVELVWRFFAIPYAGQAALPKIVDIADFLTRTSLAIASDKSFDYESAAGEFRDTFDILLEALGENAFRKYDGNAQVFSRSFLISSFEAVALGVRANLPSLKQMDPSSRAQFLGDRVRTMWSSPGFTDHMGSGKTPARRISNLVPFGASHFRP